MIRLKLKFSNHDSDYKSFECIDEELLSEAVDRATADVPTPTDRASLFVVLVNGLMIEPDFWAKVKIKEQDDVLITPRIQDGEFGQIFKTILIIAVSVVASVFLSPAVGGGFYGAMAVAGATLAASLALNALIPPPQANLGGDFGSVGGPESSQTYVITGQSNQINRLGVCPKVYGVHRFFPPLAANPYTELSVDPVTGETIQYICAIYDFGLGTPQVRDIKIGDTPLTTASFKDFQYAFVDPNMPTADTPPVDTETGNFDAIIDNNQFTLYRGDRTVTPLSIALNATNDESTQNSDENTKGYPAEIVLDFVCPKGLFGYSSGGAIGSRRIALNVEYALVGGNDWKSYNDINNVVTFKAVGGNDFTDFDVTLKSFLPTDAAFNTFYYLAAEGPEWSLQKPASVDATTVPDHFTFFYTYNATVFIKSGGTKLALNKQTPSQKWLLGIGSKIFLNNVYAGIITGFIDRTTYWEVTIDQPINLPVTRPPWWNPTTPPGAVYDLVITKQDTLTFPPELPISPIYTYTVGGARKAVRISAHTLGVANIVGTSTNPVYSSIRFTPRVAGQYKVRVRRTGTTGDFGQQVGDELTWGAITTNFESTPIFTTNRHMFMELRIRATDQLNGTIQNLSAIVAQPVLVYKEDSETWEQELSSNPAWVFCDLLTSNINKKAISHEKLHLPSILAWAEYCDEIPEAPPGQSFSQARFSCNFILDYESTLQEVLNTVTSASQASLNIIDGKYGVLVDRLKTVPVQIFTPRNSSGFSSNRFFAPRPHAVKVKYIDPNLAWEISEVVVYDNGYDATNATEFEELTSFACTVHDQAWRFGRYMLAQNRLRQETISLLVDFENLVCTRGDYVQVCQDIMQVGGRPARVKAAAGNVIETDEGFEIDPDITSWGYTFRTAEGEIVTSTLTPLTPRSFEVDGTVPAVGDLIVIGEVGKIVIDCIIKSIAPNDDMSAQLTLVERANEIFDSESESELPEYDPQLSRTSSDAKPPRAVTDLVAQEVGWECSPTQSGYQFYALLLWDIPAGSVYELFEIWYNNGAGYRAVATTTLKTYKLILDATRIGTTMSVKVVAVSVSGKKLDLIEMPEVSFETEAKTSLPSDVEGFGASITQQVLQLAWDPLDDCDVFKYEIRFSPTDDGLWNYSTQLQIVDRNVNSLAVQARTGTYLIKAVDFAGNKSATAAAIITSIPNLFDLNVIDTLNDAPTFPGDMDRLELSGTSLVLQKRVVGDPDTLEYYDEGYYTIQNLVDTDDIYSVRLQSLIRARGSSTADLMSQWDPLSEIVAMHTVNTDDWNAVLEYRATAQILAMASWTHLYDVDSLEEGFGDGFTEWRSIPTIGDATARVFQFRVRLQSFRANVTPRLTDTTINVDMPDRIDSLENLVSTALNAYQVDYSYPFAGPGTSPNIQITMEDGLSGDYWVFETKTLEGFSIRFYDNTNTQVVRTFDVAAKGYGRRNTSTI